MVTTEEVSTARRLGALEQWFFHMDKNRPAHFSTVVQIAGGVFPDEIRKALGQLQERHPLLNVTIGQEAGAGLTFETRACHIPLIVKRRDSDLQWHQEVENEAATRIDTSVAPLLRVLLLDGGTRSEMIFTAHHSIADGMALLLIIRDFFAIVGGKHLESLSLPPSIEDRRSTLSLETVAPVSVEDDITEPSPVLTFRDAARRVHIDVMRLSEADTARIIRSVRGHHVTLHAALSAALAYAGSERSSLWNAHPIRTFSPMNLRAAHGMPDDVVPVVGAGVVRLRVKAAGSFWEVAEQALARLKPFRAKGAEFFLDSLLGELAKAPHTIAEQMLARFGYELMLTNPGLIEYELESDGWTVTDLWGPFVTFGFQGEQSVSAITFKGVLHLTHSSADPIPGLLQRAVEILQEHTA